VFREALERRNPAATAAELDKEERRPLRAPVLFVVSARLRVDPKIPEIEQLLSAGTAAHAILLALHARGYAGMWRTGAPAYDPHVKRALGLLESDAIVAFVYAGTPTQPAPPIERPSPADFASEWTNALNADAGAAPGDPP
jgi:nitroreductase